MLDYRPVWQHPVHQQFQSPLLPASPGKTGIHDFSFHDLRHTHATLLLAKGVNPKIVQERLGHSTITLTLDTYSHLVPDIQKAAVRALDDLGI